MIRLPNSYLAILIVTLMFFSLLGNTLISYNLERGVEVLGSAREETGIVKVDVTAPSRPGPTPTGGGGGGAPPRVIVIELEKDKCYDLTLTRGDTVRVIFENGLEYDFIVTKISKYTGVSFKLEGIPFDVKLDEITYIDLDADTLNDLTIEYRDGKVIFCAFHEPRIEKPVIPVIISKKVIKQSGEEIPFVSQPNFILFLILLILIVSSFIYYEHNKLKRLEKTHRKGKSKLRKSIKESIFNKDKRDRIINLERQMGVLERSYRSKLISESSYLKSKAKVRRILKKLKE